MFSFPLGFPSLPWQNLYSYHVGIWLPMIRNKVYERLWSLIKPGCFEKFWVEAFYYSIRVSLSLAKLLMSLRKSWCHQQSSLFWLLGLLSLSLVNITEIGENLGCNNIEKHGEWAVCKTTYMTRVKGSERRPVFYF